LDNFIYQGIELFLPPGDHNDDRPGRGKRFGGGPSDARRGAGDQCGTVVQVSRHILLLRSGIEDFALRIIREDRRDAEDTKQSKAIGNSTYLLS
jgi:hypothetical protein